MKALVGYTGFVGQNLWASGDYDRGYNSKNIEEAFGTKPELLVYAGVRAEKFLANKNPERDAENIQEAFENIQKIDPQKLVLISTIDVFKNPNGKDEASRIDMDGLEAYGANRYRLEFKVREFYPEATIIRLPGLFGQGIKKNFIYDFMTRIPAMLKYEKFDELSEKEPVLTEYYERLDNGFYKLLPIAHSEEDLLKEKFNKLGFTSLLFTDSRSKYQFYPLSHLSHDVNTVLENNIHLFHPATEPVSAGEVYTYLTGEKFVNELSGNPADYDYKTIYDGLFGGSDGYIMTKQEVLNCIKEFVNA